MKQETFKNNFEYIVMFFTKIGLKFLSWEDYENAYIVFSTLESLTMLGKYGRFVESRVMALNNIGYYYQKKNTFGLAIEYYKKSLSYLDQYKVQKGRAQTHLNLSTLYYQLQGLIFYEKNFDF